MTAATTHAGDTAVRTDLSMTQVSERLTRLGPIGLDAVNECAQLHTRKDRKYVLSTAELVPVLDALPDDVRILEIDRQRWFGYESVYFDTDGFDSYRLAATRRPSRFKVRARTYVDSGLCVAEVKTKDRRGRTVKTRQELTGAADSTAGAIRSFASTFSEVAPYAADLAPVLTSRYHRATLVFPLASVRATIDARFRCVDAHGASFGFDDRFIIETKTAGAPSFVDRALWQAGHRPVKISKYATGLAALNAQLAANRWAPVLRDHFADSPRSNERHTCALAHPNATGGVQ